MKSWKQLVVRTPIVGYMLKVGHDFIKLPVIRRDLHNEALFLRQLAASHEAEATSARREVAEMRSKLALIEQHFSTVLDHMSHTAAAVHALEEQGSLIRDRISAIQDEVRPLRQHVEAFPAALRKAVRLADDTARRVADLSSRVGAMPAAEQIERTETRLLQMFEALDGAVAQHGAKAAITEQNLSSILDHMSNAAAAIHSLEDQVKSVQEQVELFPIALREARRSEREVLKNFEQRLAVLSDRAIKHQDNLSDLNYPGI